MLMTIECDHAPDASRSQVTGRPWRCATGEHVLGTVQHEHGVSRLHLPAGHVITGHALIYCVECDRHREWHSAADGIAELLSRRHAPAGTRRI